MFSATPTIRTATPPGIRFIQCHAYISYDDHTSRYKIYTVPRLQFVRPDLQVSALYSATPTIRTATPPGISFIQCHSYNSYGHNSKYKLYIRCIASYHYNEGHISSNLLAKCLCNVDSSYIDNECLSEYFLWALLYLFSILRMYYKQLFASVLRPL